MIGRLKKRFLDSAFAAWIRRRMQGIFLPGFGGISVYEVSHFFWSGIRKGTLPTRASALAYNFFLAIFPSIIFLFTLIPYLPIDNFQPQLLLAIKMVLPENAYAAAEETIHEILTRQNGGLLSFGFLLALYFSTNGFNSMINAFNNTYHDLEKRKPLMQRLIAFLMVGIVTSAIFIAVGCLVYGEHLIHSLLDKGEYGFTGMVITIGKWLVIFILCWFVMSALYFLAPARRNTGWRFLSPGSLFATLFSVITSLGFAFFVNNFGNYNKIYGSLGTLIVVMIWIYLNSLVLLLGFELNASIHTARRKKMLGLKSEVNIADTKAS